MTVLPPPQPVNLTVTRRLVLDPEAPRAHMCNRIINRSLLLKQPHPLLFRLHRYLDNSPSAPNVLLVS